MLGATTNDQTAMIYGLFGPRLSSVKLEGRQRPRKGVRLGRRKHKEWQAQEDDLLWGK